MRQVVDTLGNKLVGIFKKSDGSIVVVNPNEYKKAIDEKNMMTEISELKERITHLEQLIQEFLVLNKA